MHNISLQNHTTVSHIKLVNCFHKYGFNLNQTNDGKDATELSTAEDDWVS
jgi:hypothetical protein